MLDHESVRRLRAHAQALADGAREAFAEAVVRRVFAIQAQDATAADLGIRVRGRDITAQAIRTAYEKERSSECCAVEAIEGSFPGAGVRLPSIDPERPQRNRHHDRLNPAGKRASRAPRSRCSARASTGRATRWPRYVSRVRPRWRSTPSPATRCRPPL
jgi:hypothetical protein